MRRLAAALLILSSVGCAGVGDKADALAGHVHDGVAAVSALPPGTWDVVWAAVKVIAGVALKVLVATGVISL